MCSLPSVWSLGHGILSGLLRYGKFCGQRQKTPAVGGNIMSSLQVVSWLVQGTYYYYRMYDPCTGWHQRQPFGGEDTFCTGASLSSFLDGDKNHQLNSSEVKWK